MVKKSFGVYRGLLFINLFTFLLCIVFIFVIADSLKSQSIFFWIFSILLSAINLFSIISLLTYRLVVDDSVIKESGWLGPKRSINIRDIGSIKKYDYPLLRSSVGNLVFKENGRRDIVNILINLVLAPRFRFDPFYMPIHLPMISFAGIISFKNFPLHPINPKIAEILIDINPNITVDKALVDILPLSLCNKIGIKLTIIDKIGFWLSRILLIVVISLIIIVGMGVIASAIL